MISTIVLPERVKAAIAGSKDKKRKHALELIGNKIKLLFRDNSYSIYIDVINYTFFDNFYNSFMLVDNDGKEIKYFVDEEALDNGVVTTEFKNNLFEGQIETKKQDDYIQRSDKLKVDIRIDLEEYLSDDFWKEFDKEGR